MVTLIIYFALLLISIGAVAGSVLIANYLRKSYPINYVESYFYFIILISAFGIYGIWGVAFIKTVLDQITISNKILILLSQIIPYLGFPFLIMAWYMFLKFCFELSASKIPQWVTVLYFIFQSFFFIGLGLFIIYTIEESSKVPSIELVYVFMMLDMIFTGWGLFYLTIKTHRSTPVVQSGFLQKYVTISLILLIIRISTVILFYFYPLSIPAFILFYFLSIVLPLAYLYKKISDLINSYETGDLLSSRENIFARYGITRREREIINQVCAGKSNQEIADTLFISLQTVKDHTHRIYLKMDIKSRVQLMNLMQKKIP